MDKEELELLVDHSKVFKNLYDSDELKDSGVLKEFGDISLKAILEGKEKFKPFDRLIRTLNLFFKYDIDIYPQLLDYLVNSYVFRLKHNDVTYKTLSHPVMMDVKKTLNNLGLYKYIFTGNTIGLRPEDVFRSKELLSVSTQHFEEEEFTSEVVAEGISSINTTKEIEVMFAYLETYPFVVMYIDLVKESIEKDNINLFKYLVIKHEDRKSVRSIVGIENRYNCINYAASNGSLKCLKYIHENMDSWHEESCQYALQDGYINCLKYCPNRKGNTLTKIGGSHIECIKHAHENGDSSKWSEETCIDAAFGGHLDCLKYLHENGCPWNEDTCSNAASSGHLNCLKYAHEKGGASLWDEWTCREAASSGHLDCLKYARENGCPWDEETCIGAAEGGHLDCLKYAHENGGASLWDEDTCTIAAFEGHLDCLKYAHENGCPWDRRTSQRAAEGGNLDCLVYIYEESGTSTWDRNLCGIASQYGHLDCLEYTHKKGANQTSWAYSIAAENGHLDCLKYTHENGFPLNCSEETYSIVVENGHTECLKYIQENGCSYKSY
jgi:hypothetical protein